MRIPRIHLSFRHLAPALCAIFCVGIFAAQARAQAEKEPAAADKSATADKAAGTDKAATDKSALPPLPAPAYVQQSMELNGKTLHYTVTVGALPVRDKDGKTAGEVVLTAYTVEGENRPVTFAMNGGPGAASVYLNFGAIGPKHLQAGNEGDSPSDPRC
jgi:carboxypeptidase C (cathepsin A)